MITPELIKSVYTVNKLSHEMPAEINVSTAQLSVGKEPWNPFNVKSSSKVTSTPVPSGMSTIWKIILKERRKEEKERSHSVKSAARECQTGVRQMIMHALLELMQRMNVSTN